MSAKWILEVNCLPHGKHTESYTTRTERTDINEDNYAGAQAACEDACDLYVADVTCYLIDENGRELDRAYVDGYTMHGGCTLTLYRGVTTHDGEEDKVTKWYWKEDAAKKALAPIARDSKSYADVFGYTFAKKVITQTMDYDTYYQYLINGEVD